MFIVFVAGVCAGGALAVPGPPAAAPPKPAQKGGPPPAWVESPTKAAWLAYGSYCWTTACADYIPPAQRVGLPQLSVTSGQRVRIHLGFKPSHVLVRLLPSNRTIPLAAARVTAWRAAAGVASIEVKGAHGSASYVMRIRLRK